MFDVAICGMLLLLLLACDVPTGISVCRLIPLVCSFLVGRPPVRFPVGFVFRFAGLSDFPCIAIFSFCVKFFGRPVFSSSLNLGCCGAVGFSTSKKT